MKLKVAYEIMEVGDEWMAVLVGSEEETHRVIRINKTGADIFRLLSYDIDEEQLVAAMCNMYPRCDKNDVESSVKEYVSLLRKSNMLSE